MDNIFIIACAISICFCIFKFIEMRFIEKETIPIKLLLKDSIIVYTCSLIGYYLLDQLHPVIKNISEKTNVDVFTGDPNF